MSNLLQFITLYGCETIPDVSILQLPGTEGESGVYDRHANLVTRLQSGMVKWTVRHESFEKFIRGGYAWVSSARWVLVLTDSQEKVK